MNENEPNNNEPNDKINYEIGIFDPEGKNPNPLNGNPFSDSYKTLAKFWMNLPAYSMAKEIAEIIKKNEVILLQSGTGSGKSVLNPKICLHVNGYKGLVVMTLPKKLITLKASEFSAKTLDVELGEQVGYAYRGDSMKSEQTSLLYCTDGLVTAMMKSDPTIKNIDILIIDEAHERKVQIDLLLYLARNAIKIRKERNMKPLKLVIMSATINESIFRAYYRDFSYDYLFMSGTPNYPIESIYLEAPLNIKNNQYLESGVNIIVNIVNKIKSGDKKFPEGDILFFVCTISECEKMTLKISDLIKDAFVMALYSGFDSELEPYISSLNKYKELNSNYKRRIFVSTNVAESSLTIDGLRYVIDSGLAMSVRYDPIKKCNVMEKNIITKAQISQRKGRSGRTQPGTCYHLYTPEQEASAKEFPDPEIIREDMKNVCLSLMKLGCQINKTDFTLQDTIKMFTDFIEPPLESFITDGLDFAINNSLIVDNLLSKKGRLIIESRLDVTDGLTLLYAWNISEELFKDVFRIICIQSYLKHGLSDFFHSNIDTNKKDKIIQKLSSGCKNSEHLLLLKIYLYIQENKNANVFNIGLFNDVEKLYNNQIEKMQKTFKRYDVKIEDINIGETTHNTVCAFNYGFKINRAFKSGGKFKYNDMICDLSKSAFKYDKYKSIIFYSNLYMNGKLKITIVSPWLLN
jgi:HrpA-like RNA helicase